MTSKYKAIATGISNSKHTDVKSGEKLKFEDIYTINTDYFNSREDIYNYIRHDMLLVLGGGYTTDTVDNATVKIEVLS